MLSKLMDRFPAIIYLGAAILGRVGGEMIMTDAVIVQTVQPAAPWRYGVQAFCAGAVVLIGWLWSRQSESF
jgi:predicted tellurium resistance membrane protein TerC